MAYFDSKGGALDVVIVLSLAAWIVIAYVIVRYTTTRYHKNLVRYESQLASQTAAELQPHAQTFADHRNEPCDPPEDKDSILGV
jgi:hypothetical protein